MSIGYSLGSVAEASSVRTICSLRTTKHDICIYPCLLLNSVSFEVEEDKFVPVHAIHIGGVEV